MHGRLMWLPKTSWMPCMCMQTIGSGRLCFLLYLHHFFLFPPMHCCVSALGPRSCLTASVICLLVPLFTHSRVLGGPVVCRLDKGVARQLCIDLAILSHTILSLHYLSFLRRLLFLTCCIMSCCVIVIGRHAAHPPLPLEHVFIP